MKGLTPDAVFPRTKKPDEVFRVEWDFTKDLADGDSPAAVTPLAVKVYEDETGADVTSALVSGTPAMVPGEPNVARALIQAGVAGVTYLIRYKLTTTSGETLVRVVQLRVG